MEVEIEIDRQRAVYHRHLCAAQAQPHHLATLPTPSCVPFVAKPPYHTATLTGSCMNLIMTDSVGVNLGMSAVVTSVGDGGRIVATALSSMRQCFDAHGMGTQNETRAAIAVAFAHMPIARVDKVTAAVCNPERGAPLVCPRANCARLRSSRSPLQWDSVAQPVACQLHSPAKHVQMPS